MKKKIALALILVGILAALGFKLVYNYETSAKTATQVPEQNPVLQIDELKVLTQEEGKLLLVYIFAKGDCESCSQAVVRDLPLVDRIESETAGTVKVIRINIFDYQQEELTKLAQRYQLSQVPTTVIVDREGKVAAKFEQEFPEEQVRQILNGVTR